MVRRSRVERRDSSLLSDSLIRTAKVAPKPFQHRLSNGTTLLEHSPAHLTPPTPSPSPSTDTTHSWNHPDTRLVLLPLVTMDSYLTHPPKPFNSIKPSIKPRPPPQSTTLTPLQGGLRLENKAILSKMGTDESGITNSTSYERTMHIVSVGTGHQGGPADGPRPKWGKTRNMKLKQQAVKGEGRFFEGVVAYVNGYTGECEYERDAVGAKRCRGGCCMMCRTLMRLSLRRD